MSPELQALVSVLPVPTYCRSNLTAVSHRKEEQRLRQKIEADTTCPEKVVRRALESTRAKVGFCSVGNHPFFHPGKPATLISPPTRLEVATRELSVQASWSSSVVSPGVGLWVRV